MSRVVRLSLPLAPDIDRTRTTRRGHVTSLPHAEDGTLCRYLASEPPGDGVVGGEV